MRLVCEVRTIQGDPSDIRYALQNVPYNDSRISKRSQQKSDFKNQPTCIKHVRHNVFFKQRQEKGDNSYLPLDANNDDLEVGCVYRNLQWYFSEKILWDLRRR